MCDFNFRINKMQLNQFSIVASLQRSLESAVVCTKPFIQQLPPLRNPGSHKYGRNCRSWWVGWFVGWVLLTCLHITSQLYLLVWACILLWRKVYLNFMKVNVTGYYAIEVAF